MSMEVQAVAVDVQSIFDMHLDTDDGVKSFAEKLQPYLTELSQMWADIKALEEQFKQQAAEQSPQANETGLLWMQKTQNGQARLVVLLPIVEAGQKVLEDPIAIIALALKENPTQEERTLLERVSLICRTVLYTS